MKYMGSKRRILKYILPIINQDKDKPFYDVFCLEENTNLYTENGIVKIKDINIGDFIYDDNGELKRVIRKVKSDKTDGICIKTKGNLEIKATLDHIFYDDDGNEIKGFEVYNKTLLTGKSENYIEYIDLIDQVNKSNGTRFSQSGKILDNGKLKLSHVADKIDRYIKIDEKLMYCYGISVAEGDKSSINLHRNEKESIGEKFIKHYSEITNIDCKKNKIFTLSDNRCQVSIPKATIYKKIIFEKMGIGYGARNKNISFLFKVSPEMFKIAFKAMVLGDGCIVNKKNKYRSINYKTSSYILAKQLQTLLSIKLGIKSTFSQGINKERFIKGRRLEPSKYYNIGIHRSKDVESIIGKADKEIKVEKTKKFFVNSVEKCKGIFYDITLEDGSTNKFILDGGVVTHNCGGGNVIEKIGSSYKVANDNNEYLIAMFQALQNGWVPETFYSEEQYQDIRQNKDRHPKHLVGYVGFASYGGKFFGGYPRDSEGKRNYFQEYYNNITKQLPNIMDVKFICCEYSELHIPSGSVIYCDPPYKGTTKYSKNFDYEKYYDWCQHQKSLGNEIYMSEYWMPDDFKCVWTQQSPMSTSLTKDTGSKKGIEKLFTL